MHGVFIYIIHIIFYIYIIYLFILGSLSWGGGCGIQCPLAQQGEHKTVYRVRENVWIESLFGIGSDA